MAVLISDNILTGTVIQENSGFLRIQEDQHKKKKKVIS